MKVHKRRKQITNLLSRYSADDLLRSFFIINMWLPNIGAQIRLQYLYVVLEALHSDLAKDNRIRSYEDFIRLFSALVNLVPSFPSIEDFVTHCDWGEIRYFFRNKFFKIFNGTDLSSTYDFLYSFETTHSAFEASYRNILNRSSLDELEFILSFQNSIIENLPQTTISNSDINPGDLSIPSEEFWIEGNRFLTRFDPKSFLDSTIADRYTFTLDDHPMTKFPSIDKFRSNAFQGMNCKYFLIKTKNQYYPVLSRKMISTFIDFWGDNLKGIYSQIKLERAEPDIRIAVQFREFVRQRIKRDQFLPTISVINEEDKRHILIFPCAILSENTLFLFSIAPPAIDGTDLTNFFGKLHQEILGAEVILKAQEVPRFFSFEQKQILELRKQGNSGRKLNCYFITLIPECTAGFFLFHPPDNFPGRIVWMNEILGIIDELSEPDELAAFFRYLPQLESYKMPPILSLLDKFASFKDSKSVLVAGANEPDVIALDPHWGSEYRHRSLSSFWQSFPKMNFVGHPRSWFLTRESTDPLGGVLSSKIREMSYLYFSQVGETVMFIRAPSDLMSFEQGNLTDLLMGSLADALQIYSVTLRTLPFSEKERVIEIALSPSSLVRENKELEHLLDMIPKGTLWSMDHAEVAPLHYAIAVVFDDSQVLSALLDAHDRSTQIALLIDVLKQINMLIPSETMSDVEVQLLAECGKPARYQALEVEKKVSFAFLASETLPEATDFKIANKAVAKIARDSNIVPGKYSLDAAKKKLNELVAGLLSKLESEIGAFTFSQAAPVLIDKIESLIHKNEIDMQRIKGSLKHEVDYERDKRSAKYEKEFLRYHRVFRYLLEKFVQLQPEASQEFGINELKGLLAKADRLMDIYSVSDVLHYQIYPTQVDFSHDFLLDIEYEVDVPGMEETYGKEKAKIELGLIGKKDDVPVPTDHGKNYMNKIDEAFFNDFGFGLRQLIAIQQVLSIWPIVTSDEAESSHYWATPQQISDSCQSIIKGLDLNLTQKILDFLTLGSDDVTKILGKADSATDIPIWEHWKRKVRYTIHPLIRMREGYLWGPYSVNKAAIIWSNVPDECRLPNDIHAPLVTEVLEVAHKNRENSLAELAKNIAERFTSFVIPEMYPHKLDPEVGDIGDFDTFAYLNDTNVILNIESKIIDPAYCLKDTKRIREKIFGRTKSDGTFEQGYLQKVERRAEYLNSKSIYLLEKLQWLIPATPPTIISIFVTQLGFWWTRFPPVQTEVNFVECRLLDGFIRNLMPSIRNSKLS